MTNEIIRFFLWGAVVVGAGVLLTYAADLVAVLTRLGRFLVGSVFLAGATSMPELVVDISAVHNGMPNLAVGDLMGSSLMNLLILAVADLLTRSPHKMLSQTGAKHALAGSMSINITAVAAAALFIAPFMPQLAFGGISAGILTIGLVYFLGLRMIYFDQQSYLADVPVREDNASRRSLLLRALLLYLVGIALIAFAAPQFASSAGDIAEKTGLGGTFIGSTIVAFCTSLPELVSTVAALRMSAFDLAVGNILGSNAFNMVLLVPLDAIYPGNLLADVSRSHILTALTVIITTSVAVMGQLCQEPKRRRLVETDAITMILLIIAALYLLYKFRSIQ